MLQVSRSSLRLRRMLIAALFIALAYASLFLFHFKVMFLTFEFKDAFITIGGMLLGPLWALIMSVATALLEFFTISDTGWYGLIMNVTAALAFSVPASLVYRFRRTFGGAIAGLALAVAALVGVMLPMNRFITPYFMVGVTIEAVLELLPTLILPFNLLKGLMNTSVVLLLYKPVTRALRAAHLTGTVTIERSSGDDGAAPAEAVHKRGAGLLRRAPWVVPLAAVALFLLSLLLFFVVLHGQVAIG